MAWNADIATKRVQAKADDLKVSEISVSPLTREMDLGNLGPKDVRRAKAAHIYADVVNLHLLVAAAGGDKQKQKKLVRAASVLRRMQRDLAAESDIGRIQMQATRFHGICHKPYDGENESKNADRVTCAVTFAITLQSYLYDVFNPVFKDDLDHHFRGAVGLDTGECLIASIGFHGDRELICLGTPANIAAKAISESGTITVTERSYDLLPKCLQNKFEKTDDTAGGLTLYRASGLRWNDHEDLADELGVDWKPEKWAKQTEHEKAKFVLDEMNVTGCNGLMDVNALTEWNSKRTEAVTLYADIDGFTDYVQNAEAEGDDAVKALVRVFHLIRGEFQACIECDGYEGLALQHQGDCVLAIAHMPCGDDESDADKRRRKGLNVAMAIQSSMEHVLRDFLEKKSNLHVVVGADVGKVLVSRLGINGDREVVCFGPEVTAAQRLQTKSDARQTRVSDSIYDAINDDVLKDQFSKDDGSYLATGLTFPNLEEARDERAANQGKLSATATQYGVHTQTNSNNQSRPWSSETVP